MSYLIESDGTPRGTRVLDEHGHPLKGVQTVTWHLDIGEPMAEVTLKIRAPVTLDVRADRIE